ncbi:MAG: hypothetical protein VX246_16825 [Myxococcota bacterium]|nr:hypothetical protein [Myxococcota bacterium]
MGILGIMVALGDIGVAVFQDELRGPLPSSSEQLKNEVRNRGTQLRGGTTQQKSDMDAVSATYT